MKKLPLHLVAWVHAFTLSAVIGLGQPIDPYVDAEAAVRNRDFEKAAALLEPLTGPESSNAAAFALLSKVRLAQKQTKESIQLAEKATQLDPGKAAYFSQLGTALGQRMGEVGFLQQAALSGKLKAAFAKAVELDPKNVTGLIGLSRFYTNAPEIAGGDLGKAREFATRVLPLDDFQGTLELGTIAEKGDDLAEALKQFEAAAALKPENVRVQILCGRVLAKLKRTEEARARYEAAQKLDPNSVAAAKALAELSGAPKDPSPVSK